jgi:hypothetical protein
MAADSHPDTAHCAQDTRPSQAPPAPDVKLHPRPSAERLRYIREAELFDDNAAAGIGL